MLKSLKIPLAFLATGVCWALFSDPVITFLTKHLSPGVQDRYRSLNDFIFVIIISIVLYFEISRQQKRLHRSEEEYRQLFESNPNPIWIYHNETLRFVKVNDAAIEKYAYSRNKFLRMTIKDIRQDNQKEKLLNYIKEHEDRFKLAGNWKHRTGTGEIIDVSIVSHPVVFNNQNCNFVMATDITKVLKSEEKLQEAYKKIKNANDALRKITWSNSHELRKPVCSILGLIDLLKQSPKDKERTEYIRLLEICSTELDVIIKENNEKIEKI